MTKEMKREDIQPQELVVTQHTLTAKCFVSLLVAHELGELLLPIYVHRIETATYILDGHHRSAAARVYERPVSAFIIDTYEDCAHSNPATMTILRQQYREVRQQGLWRPPDSCRPNKSIDKLICYAYEGTMRYLLGSLSRTTQRERRDAKRRAYNRLEGWVLGYRAARLSHPEEDLTRL